jgi:hypothetical protein
MNAAHGRCLVVRDVLLDGRCRCLIHRAGTGAASVAIDEREIGRYVSLNEPEVALCKTLLADILI